MADATFDGANLYITLPNIGSFDTQTNIYSAWKEWIALSDNAKYPPAFDTTGGDSVGSGQEVAPYFFCRNDLGWRIKMPSADGEIVISGNLFPRSSDAALFEATSGFDAFVRLEVSTRAVVVETGVSGLTSQESSQLSQNNLLIQQINAMQLELYRLKALDLNTPVTVDEDTITAGDIELQRTTNNGVDTLQRI